MTLGTLLKSVLGPSTSLFHEQGSKVSFPNERNGGDYYHFGHYHKHKSKSKADKKHAILSALSLLAFLFFLNILQNCIREQTEFTNPIVMFGYQSKTPAPTEEYKTSDSGRVARSVKNTGEEDYETTTATDNRIDRSHKSRTLLQFIQRKGERQKKFIRFSGKSDNWTNELTQISDRDLEDQKLKTLNFPLYWKNNRFTTLTNNSETSNVGRKKEIENYAEAGRIIPLALRRIKKRERATEEPSGSTNETTQTSTTPTHLEVYENSLKNVQNSKYNLEKGSHIPWLYNATHNSTLNITYNIQTQNFSHDESSTKQNYSETTPRIRRSDYDYNVVSNSGILTTQTPTSDLDLNTYQTNEVQNYQNHHYNSISLQESQAFKSESLQGTSQPENQNSYNNLPKITTESSIYYSKSGPAFSEQPYQVKQKNKHVYHIKHYNRNKQPPGRYRYTPNRRITNRDSSHYHPETYYPIVLAAKYPDDDSDFDIIKFIWSMFTSFAKPLTRLVPNFGKEGTDEPQCYELLVCEAQRMFKLMGPTAETFAATIGTVLTWAATEETRQVVIDAIQSGKENTCLQQIKECEIKSGGKSAMTVIAQVLEVKKPLNSPL